MNHANNKIRILALIFCCIANLLSAQSVAVKLNLTDFFRGVGGSIEVSKSKKFSLLGEFQYLNYERYYTKADWLFHVKDYEYWQNTKGWKSTILLRFFPKQVNKGLFFEGGPYIGHYKGDQIWRDYSFGFFTTSTDYHDKYTTFNTSVSGIKFGTGAQVRIRIMVFELSGGVSLNFNNLNNHIKPYSNDANFYIRAAWGLVGSKEKATPQSGKYIWFSGK
ncbi:MAG: hypothetical protein WCR52_12620 [Bacteroidota bacterium]